ncbi:MAG: hypothetical protein BWZ07_03186 [Alphaproteobacteria bacterium ADurb.BinA280]|nr:MAG: hypothetical protein BWZ07_03186 [Alphaproteobacteria bacterium ADurb.BinA280]
MCRLLQTVAPIGCRVHAEWMKDALLHLVAEEIAGDGKGDITDQAERDILVGIALANRTGQWNFAQTRSQQGIGFVLFEQAIVGVVRQADAVAENVGNRQLAAADIVGKLECRQQRSNRRVPVQAPVTNQHRAQGGCKRLGQRSQSEHRICAHGLPGGGVGKTDAALQQDLVILDHGNRQSRHIPGRVDTIDPCIQGCNSACCLVRGGIRLRRHVGFWLGCGICDCPSRCEKQGDAAQQGVNAGVHAGGRENRRGHVILEIIRCIARKCRGIHELSGLAGHHRGRRVLRNQHLQRFGHVAQRLQECVRPDRRAIDPSL